MFNPSAYENSRSGGVAMLEVPERTEAGQPRQFVPLKRTAIAGEVAGPLAALTVTHSYGYGREQCDLTLEAIYRFPLPGDAAVTDTTVRFGEVEIRAELKERKEAEADYQEAKQQGRQAALVTRESPDVFTLSVAGIKPDEEIVVETSYVQLARAEGAGWTLRLPLTPAPRYSRTDEAGSPHAAGQPLMLLRDPGHRFSLDLTMPGAGRVESPTHDLEATEEDGATRVRLRGGEVIPDRDCVISWRMEQDRTRPALHALTHRDAASGAVYFLAIAAPPAAPDPRTAVPREAILLVDHSGSMIGPKWAAADWAVKKFLAGLADRDGFGLGVFHHQTRWLARATQKASARALKSAADFLEAATDGGGTELGVALEQALDLKRLGGEFSRHLLVITDAQVSDEGRILRLAEEESERKDRRRISVLCIDASPNSFLAGELAERGGGTAHFLTSNPEAGDIATALDEVLLDWSQPVLSGLRLEVNRPRVEASGRQVVPSGEEGWSAVDLGDLPSGRIVWVCGRVFPREGEPLRLRLAGDRGVVTALSLDPSVGPARPALKALFGAWRVLGLEFLMTSGRTGEELSARLARLGYDPTQDLTPAGEERKKIYAENSLEDVRKALGGLLLRESLDYRLLTSATGFVAVRKEAGKVVDAAVPVGNALPSGWSEDFLSVGLPQASVSATFMAAQSMPDLNAPAAPPLPAARAVFDAGPALPSFLRRKPRTPRMAEEREPTLVLFRGKPSFQAGKAMLFDSTAAAGRFSRLRLRFPGRVPDAKKLNPELTLLLYVEDLSVPLVKVRVADLVIQGGERPINLSVQPGRRLMLVLSDPSGAWSSSPPEIELSLG